LKLDRELSGDAVVYNVMDYHPLGVTGLQWR